MKLRTMTREELTTVLGWAATEGWNPGLDDVAPFHATDPDGFFVAEVEGRLAAAISVVNHTASFAFLGLYICHPDFRGLGIGYSLWRHALDHAGDRTIGLDGVPDQQDNYRRSGFVLKGETMRFEGAVQPSVSGSVREADQLEVATLIDMEAKENGYRKERFMRAWLAPTDTRQTCVHLDDGDITGFCTVRRCQKGAKIGPLVAPDIETAIQLISAAAEFVAPERVIIDVPGDNTALTAWCEAQGMSCAFTTARMYRGAAPQTGRQLFTVATLELG